MRLYRIGLVGGLMVILMLAAPMIAQPARAYEPCETYFVTYSGQVLDQAGVGLGGVVVKLSTPPGWQAFTYTTTSNSNGYWSKSVRACPYDANFYWKSNTNGPLVKTVLNIPQTGTVYTLNVWRQIEKIPVNYEFPNSPNVQISWSSSTSVKISIDASFDVGFSFGFLGVNFAGHIGTDYTVETGYTSSGTTPWRDFYPVGTVYRILDTLGRDMIYVEQYSSALFQSENWVDEITSQQAEDRMNAEGRYPFVSIAGNHVASYTRTLTVTVAIDFEFSIEVSIGGVSASLTISMGVEVGQSQSVTTTITNPDSWNKCYVLYDDGLINHVWWRSDNSCPY